MIEDLWKYEQQWLAHKPQDVRFLLHKDIFSQYILPRMSTVLLDWDNESDGDEGNVGSFEECRSKCEAASDCKQFSYSEDGHCKTRVDPRLGKATPHMKSGWFPDRIKRFEQVMAPCGDESWML
ncbi:unnamed protein product [Aureobasidium vineae]|uniref:Apple domain-containing protein n=1 Tax=Aureobasidium vineae TaxID=2773715 RepID=A0A9N8JAB3_9PEZI|nr:unnamed protein product [Aureobasidium vineae]